MRAIRLEQPREFRKIELEEPAPPGPGQALVRTHRMGICGSDVGGYLGKMPFFRYPRIPGHELGVEVLQVGPDVTNVAAGDRCSVEPYMNCGRCFACRRGRGNCCQTLEVIGVMADGGLRDRFLIRADKLHRSASLTFDQLALVETLAIGCHACDRGGSQAGDDVLIIGAGPIGLASLEFVRLTGARITVMDMVAERLEFCRRVYGIEHTVLAGDGQELDRLRAATGGDLYPVVIDATGAQRSMSACLGYAAQTGVVVYVGITTQEVSFPHPVLHKAELTLKGSRNALPADFPRIISLIEQGTIDTGRWITHRTTFDRVIDEFETFTRPESGVIKAIVDVA
ncbi:MAG: zinc-binding alcohol dehydrogenase family protein [Planctomyces sp.]|nr:zinc-binding alcohol dehydrogenase family protein [Planctomyces sp.]